MKIKIKTDIDFTINEIDELLKTNDYKIETHKIPSGSYTFITNNSIDTIGNTKNQEFAIKNGEDFNNINRKDYTEHYKDNVFKDLINNKLKMLLLG